LITLFLNFGMIIKALGALPQVASGTGRHKVHHLVVATFRDRPNVIYMENHVWRRLTAILALEFVSFEDFKPGFLR